MRLTRIRPRRSEILDWATLDSSTLPSSLCFRRTRRTRREFNTGAQVAKEHHESKRQQTRLPPKATEKRKLAVKDSNLRLWTNHVGASRLVSELLPLGCLSILRQEESGLLDQKRSQSRENTCCGRQRDTLASWFAKQNTLSRQRLDNRADPRTFTCVTQPSYHYICIYVINVFYNYSLY